MSEFEEVVLGALSLPVCARRAVIGLAYPKVRVATWKGWLILWDHDSAIDGWHFWVAKKGTVRPWARAQSDGVFPNDVEPSTLFGADGEPL